MKIELTQSNSLYQVHLHVALFDAVADYEQIHGEVSRHPPLTEETASPELTVLHHGLEQRRAVALILAATCVEAAGNLYLGFKADTAREFAKVERSNLLQKWTTVPPRFVPAYSLPEDTELYQDLFRLSCHRNSLVHLKESVSKRGVVIHAGSVLAHEDDEAAFIQRCRSLPDRLLQHAVAFDRGEATTTLAMALAFAETMMKMRDLARGAQNREPSSA